MLGSCITGELAWREGPRIYADFNNCTEDYKVRLNSVGSKVDLENAAVDLVEGAVVVLYGEEFELEGRLERAEDRKTWLAISDWSTRREIG